MNEKSDIERDFERDPMAFMRKYAVYPVDYVGKPPSLYDKPLINLPLDDKLTIKSNLHKIAYARLEEIPYNTLSAKKNSFAVKFRSAEAASGHEAKCIPMWFLPWFSNSITSLTIPPKVRPGVVRHEPDFFFTAAISGCSVFVHGNPKAPTVSHAGTEDPRATKAIETLDEKGSDGLNTGKRISSPYDKFFTSGNARSHWTSVHKRHFGANTNASSIHTGDYKNTLGSGNTAAAMQYDKFLRDNSGRELRIDDVQSSGCVFGIRDSAGSWSFYLQKNVEVKITKMKKKMHVFGKNEYFPKMVPSGRIVKARNDNDEIYDKVEMIEKTVQLSIPIQVMKFFPGERDKTDASTTLSPDTLKAIVQNATG